MAVTGVSPIECARVARAEHARADAKMVDAAVALYQEGLGEGLSRREAMASAGEEIRLALRVEKWWGEQLVARAVRLHSSFPKLLQAMREGLCTDFDARVVCEVLGACHVFRVSHG